MSAVRSRSPPLHPRRWAPTSDAQRDAGAKLFEHMISLYGRCKITAKDFSTAMWYLGETLTPGADFKLYGLHPDSQTGKFQDHLDKVLPQPKHMYMLDIPGNDHGRGARRVATHAMKCVWESLEDEITQSSDDNSTLRVMQQTPAERGETILDTNAYTQHPVTVRCREA
eukprot:1520531-Pyramimonas_sp.AAC.1